MIAKLIGIYNGDSGIRGELAYALGKMRGTASCALCDITHNGIRNNPEWKSVTCELNVPFELIHRNKRDQELIDLTGDQTPAVIAETENGYVLVMGPMDFVGTNGSAQEFLNVLNHKISNLNHLGKESTSV